MSLFEEERPRLVRVKMNLHADQIEAVRRMADRAGDGVSMAKVWRAAVREGLAVLEKRMQEQAKP